MMEAFITEVTITDDHDKIATLKHFDGGSFSVELENAIPSAEDLEAIADTIRNLDKLFVNLIDGKPFKKQ